MNEPNVAGQTKAHRRERFSFVVLQHVQTLSRDASTKLIPDAIAADLGAGAEETRDVLTALSELGLVDWNGASGAARLTALGSDYLEQAGRRRSVRFEGVHPRGPERTS